MKNFALSLAVIMTEVRRNSEMVYYQYIQQYSVQNYNVTFEKLGQLKLLPEVQQKFDCKLRSPLIYGNFN